MKRHDLLDGLILLSRALYAMGADPEKLIIGIRPEDAQKLKAEITGDGRHMVEAAAPGWPAGDMKIAGILFRELPRG